MSDRSTFQLLESTDRFKLTAYRIPGKRGYPQIVPASPSRMWMDLKTGGWANRCLPLRIANQAGWLILNDVEFEVTWNGNNGLDAVKITFKDKKSYFVESMFGYGVLTWAIPYLFRTEPGFNLLARGPANSFKDGVSPLEGIVETDWLPYPFTMNWKLTRPNKAIKFERDEPICMLTPLRRNDIDQFQPDIVNLTSEPELEKSYRAWHEVRLQKVQESRSKDVQKEPPKTQGHYIRGEGVLAEKAEEHQNKLKVEEFLEREPAVITSPPPAANTAESKPPEGLWSRLFPRKK